MADITMRYKKVVILTAVSFCISAGLYLSGLLSAFELKAFDLYSRKLNPSTPVSDIVIVQIDQRSIDALTDEGVTWPWPRQVYAPILEYLSEADAVFIDILYTEPSSYGMEDDAIFSSAVKKASNVFLPVFLTNQERRLSTEDTSLISGISVNAAADHAPSYKSAIMPIETLKGAARGYGNVTISPDPDGVYRRVPLLFTMDRFTLPNFMLGHLLQKGVVTVQDRHLHAGSMRIPLTQGRMLLRYNTARQPFTVFSSVDILRASIDSSKVSELNLRRDFFRGKKVFIGLTAAGLYDMKPTSVSSVSTGVHVHATALENIVHSNFIRQLPASVPVVLMLIITFFITATVIQHYSITRNAVVFLCSLFAAFICTALLFRNGLYLEILPLPFSLVISFICAAAYSYATEGKKRLFYRKAFMQYMDKKLVDHLLADPALIRPGGQRRRVTVFFSDIAGFTTLSEQIPAEQLSMVLHAVLNECTEVIISNEGVIDKYIGDAIMAFWGAPVRTDHDETFACRAALQCIRTLSEINQRFRQQGLTEISMRIGINSGDAIVGNLGSDRLFDYTVVGDTVNLASRLESVNKVFGTAIIVSDETLLATADAFESRELGQIEVKGKSIPVRIHELICEKGAIDTQKQNMRLMYHEALALYRAKSLGQALELFKTILQQYPEDGPSKFYSKRIESLVSEQNLTGDWDVVKMTEK